MRIIALLPVRNEAWVLDHTLRCLSAFCDVILVNDQRSTDGSREIAMRFPKTVWIESLESRICEQARWQLWDVARQYDGNNVLWCTDADELVSPAQVRHFLGHRLDELRGGNVIDANYCHFWNDPHRYRSGLGAYAPYWKAVAIVDDRRLDYDRSRALPLHEERVPIRPEATRVRADEATVLHLQWLLPNRSQMRQAWYRCREWLQRERSAAEINRFYAITLPRWHVPTAPIPGEWLQDLTLPGTAIDRDPSWQQAEIVGWFDAHGIELFEPLEIWHVPVLREEFKRRTGRTPRPDRSYREPFSKRARTFSRHALNAVKRTLAS
ncbi:MAG TPA: glycosyltransferase [Vicinamibacterales bacterium]|nr:glycosyltransferase [Vicinamibacterales bacterium]